MLACSVKTSVLSGTICTMVKPRYYIEWWFSPFVSWKLKEMARPEFFSLTFFSLYISPSFQIIENRRHSATRRRSMEERTCSSRSIPRRLEYNRREHDYSHSNHRGNCRHCEEVPHERNAHSCNSPRSQNSFRLQWCAVQNRATC